MGWIIRKALSLIAILATMSIGTAVHAETIDTRIGKLDFELGVPTKETVATLYDELDFQRACQLYLWAIPIISSAQERRWAEFTAGARDGDVMIMEGYRSLSQALTPNVVTPYVAPVVNLANTGPVVLDVPAGLIAGAVDDFWQRLISDVGVTGPDRRKGAKYLLVGPGQEVPETKDAVVPRSPTFGLNIFVRALDPDPTKAEAVKTSVRVYPWSQRANPPAARYLKPDSEKVTKLPGIPRGMEYWKLPPGSSGSRGGRT